MQSSIPAFPRLPIREEDRLQINENNTFPGRRWCRLDSLSAYILRYTSFEGTCGRKTANMDLESASYSSIPRQSLPSAVADKLRDQIIRGEIPEGAQLRQDAIATQYGVSRIPVREALRQLDAEG